jgi:hypothetical protein
MGNDAHGTHEATGNSQMEASTSTCVGRMPTASDSTASAVLTNNVARGRMLRRRRSVNGVPISPTNSVARGRILRRRRSVNGVPISPTNSVARGRMLRRRRSVSGVPILQTISDAWSRMPRPGRCVHAAAALRRSGMRSSYPWANARINCSTTFTRAAPASPQSTPCACERSRREAPCIRNA